MENTLNLGDFVKCKVTGFEGVVDCICSYLNKSTDYRVISKNLTEKGGFIQNRFEFEGLEIIESVAEPKAKETEE